MNHCGVQKASFYHFIITIVLRVITISTITIIITIVIMFSSMPIITSINTIEVKTVTMSISALAPTVPPIIKFHICSQLTPSSFSWPSCFPVSPESSHYPNSENQSVLYLKNFWGLCFPNLNDVSALRKCMTTRTKTIQPANCQNWLVVGALHVQDAMGRLLGGLILGRLAGFSKCEVPRSK